MVKRSENLQRWIISMVLITGFYCLFSLLDGAVNWRAVKVFIRTENYVKAIIYGGLYLSVVVSLFLLFLHKNRLASGLAFLLLFFTVAIDFGYKQLNGTGLTYEDILLATQNMGFDLEGEVLKTYLPTISYASFIALLIAGIVWLVRKLCKNIRFQSNYHLTVPVAVFLAVMYTMYASNGNRSAYPIPFKVPALLIYASQKGLYSGEREAVYLKNKTSPLAKHIVWIVDESVRPDVLEINGFQKPTSPFLRTLRDSLLNYGIASSGSVCSDYSHIMLMSGLQLKELPDLSGKARKKPTIFQYANAAGMESNLLYAPGHEDVPKGYMTPSDFTHIINRFYTKKIYPGIAPHLIDLQSIDILEKIIGEQSSSFTYFLKYGCHFHYESTYPPEKRFFQPVQDIESWSRENREELLNSYYNAIRWEVDYFFETLYKRFEGQDVLIIYTSDHGQHLMEYPEIKMTHCIKEAAPPEMAMVPLFLLPMNARLRDSLQTKYQEENVDKASHFNIFPTTLALMGYDPKEVSQVYGSSIFDPLSELERTFISGDIFGRSRVYLNKFEARPIH